MALRTLPAVTFPAPTAFPTVGYGGSYFDKPAFKVPTYGTRPYANITWRLLEDYARVLASKNSADGIAAGVAWATFIYLLALTPNKKRTSPFHTSLILGVAFLLIHLMINLISPCMTGLNKYSAYAFLVGTENVIITSRFISVQAASLIAEIISFCCASLCLWLQAKGLMTSMQNRFPRFYRIILGYLIFTSVATIVAQTVYIVKSINKISKSSNKVITDYLMWIIIYHCLFAVSIGSYSLVSMCSIVSIIWKRPSSVVKGHNAYASALNLVGLLCAQSFVLPFIFCVLLLSISPVRVWVDPSVMILPTVYLIIPLGTLFMTINQKPTEIRQDDNQYKPALSPTKPSHLKRDQSPTLTNNSTNPISSLTAFYSDLEPGNRHQPTSPRCNIEQELAAIDIIDTTTIDSRSHKGRETIVQKDAPRPDSCVLSGRTL